MKNSRSGFALLFVYAMAATIAIMLLMSLPRVAFEAQRDKEQLLIDRGEQYSRAVNLFVRKFNRYPSSVDDLQSTQNLRFLRKTYVDPFTGKAEWRLIHVGPNGVFIDSLVYNKKKDDTTQTAQQNFITVMQQTGGNPVDPNASSALGNQANRDAIRNEISALGASLSPGQLPPSDPSAAAGTLPGNPAPVQNFPPPIGANGQPILANQPGSPQSPVSLPPGVQPPAGVQLPPGVLPPGLPLPGQQQGQQPQPNGPPTSASDLLNQILTTPRPGGLPGSGAPQAFGAGGLNAPAATTTTGGATSATTVGGTTANQAGTQIVGGGIAGIASKVEQEGIKTYKDKKKYNEWEFVYDITKDPTRVPQAAPAAGATGATSGSSTTQGVALPALTPQGATMTPPPTAPPTQ